MKIIVIGHRYELPSMEGKNPQTIQFVQKEKDETGAFSTVSDGTTNESVLEMMIDRLNHLQQKAQCRENAIVITKLEECLMWLNKRTEDRKKRGVEGTPAK